MLALIVILLTGPTDSFEIKASNLGVFNTFQECFAARESFSTAVFGLPSGYYPPNSQAVCIQLAFKQGT